MSHQSKKQSVVESVTNVSVGYGVSLAANVTILPLFGIVISMSDNVVVTGSGATKVEK